MAKFGTQVDDYSARSMCCKKINNYKHLKLVLLLLLATGINVQAQNHWKTLVVDYSSCGAEGVMLSDINMGGWLDIVSCTENHSEKIFVHWNLGKELSQPENWKQEVLTANRNNDEHFGKNSKYPIKQRHSFRCVSPILYSQKLIWLLDSGMFLKQNQKNVSCVTIFIFYKYY